MNNLSVIIPAYNIEEYIGFCIESILKQTYKCDEIIIVDDGSIDKTLEVCYEFSNRYKNIIVIEQKHKGVVSTRKHGLELASCDNVIFIDGDDYIENDMFESMMKYVDKYDYVSCGVYRHFSNSRILTIKDAYSGAYEKEEMKYVYSNMIYNFEKEMQQPMTPWIYNKVFDKKLALKIMNTIPKDIMYAEDSAFVYKYILRCRNAYFIEKPLYHYRYRARSVYHSINDKMLENNNIVYLCLKEDFEKQPEEYKLMLQLQKWIVIMTMNAINKYLGFADEVKILQYWIDVKDITGKRIVLYGAGAVGQSVYRQLIKKNENVVAWVDKDYEYYKNIGYEVTDLKGIEQLEYDIVLVAVRDEKLFYSIKNDLKDVINEMFIVWIKPELLY